MQEVVIASHEEPLLVLRLRHGFTEKLPEPVVQFVYQRQVMLPKIGLLPPF